MLIALLAILGVNLIVIAAFAVFVPGRRRWLKRQPSEFAGAIRVSGGDVDDLNPKWKRGSGRWVRDVLVWSKAPLMFRNELVPADGLLGEHPGHDGGVKRLGDKPVVIEFASGARIEVAARAGHRAPVTGPLTVDVSLVAGVRGACCAATLTADWSGVLQDRRLAAGPGSVRAGAPPDGQVGCSCGRWLGPRRVCAGPPFPGQPALSPGAGSGGSAASAAARFGSGLTTGSAAGMPR